MKDNELRKRIGDLAYEVTQNAETYLQTYEPTELVHISSIITACSSAMMKTGSPDTVAIDRRMILLEYYDHPVVTNKSDYFHHPY